MARKSARDVQDSEIGGAVRTGRPAVGPQKKMLLKMPLAYLAILETEAARLALSNRGALLTILVLHRSGQIALVRKDGPTYYVGHEDLETKGSYTWYTDPQLALLVDELRLRLGGLGVGDFFVLLINEWLGQPQGLPLRPTAAAEGAP